MLLKTIVGLSAALLTTISFLPQALKTWRTKSTQDLSPLMFTLFCTGVVGWLVYGFFLHDIVIIVANSITIILAGSIMYHILKNHTNTPSTHINHVALWVSDIEKAKLFYTQTFSAKVSNKYQNAEKNFCSYFLTLNGGSKLELMSHLDGNIKLPPPSLNHFAISVGSRKRVDSITKQLQAQGTEIKSSPRITGDGYYESVVVDPEGNLIEITI